MSKSIEWFTDMIECNQLDYGDEDVKCKIILHELEAFEKIKKRLQIKSLALGIDDIFIKDSDEIFIASEEDDYDIVKVALLDES